MVSTSLYPFAAAMKASPMPVLPVRNTFLIKFTVISHKGLFAWRPAWSAPACSPLPRP